jgi:hypothetical protein
MAVSGRDAAFLTLACDLRPVLRRCARLLYVPTSAEDALGAAERAERVVDSALARAYADTPDDPEAAAFRLLIRPDWRLVGSTGSERVQLVDVAPTHPGSLLGELVRLDTSAREAIVLTLVAGLTAERAAEILATPPSRIPVLVSAAGDRLLGPEAYRRDPAELRRRLEVLAGPLLNADHHSDGRGSAAAIEDLSRGRRLRRHRRLRRSATVAAALAVVVLTAARLVKPPVEPAAPPPSITPTSGASVVHAAPCDPGFQPCQARLMRSWRVRTSSIMTEHLDPRRRYFSGYSYAYNDAYDSPGFWNGQGGTLALQLERLEGGATEVYLQIASASRFADRCGERTDKPCYPVEFMDGNSLLMTGGITASDGIEVQYEPATNEVITVVARNVSAGRPLHVTTADLVDLVQDPRLRLPGA